MVNVGIYLFAAVFSFIMGVCVTLMAVKEKFGSWKTFLFIMRHKVEKMTVHEITEKGDNKTKKDDNKGDNKK